MHWIALLLGAHAKAALAQEQGEGAALATQTDESVTPPIPLSIPEISYPPEALAAGTEGDVLVNLTISAEGYVEEVEVVDAPSPALGEAVARAAPGFVFQPATRGPRAIRARIRFSHSFRLPPPAPVDLPPAVAQAASQPSDAKASAPVEVRVQGSSVASNRERSAEAVLVTDLAEAREKSADLGDVLARSGGVTVRRLGGLGSNANLTLGGLTGEQIPIFIDGLPLEVSGFPFGIANIPINLVDRVEVHQGVVPLRFGADALGGAIELVTDQNVRESRFGASYQVGSFETQRATASGQVYQPKSGLFARASGYFDKTDNDYPVFVDLAAPDGTITQGNAQRFHDGYEALGGSFTLGVVDRPYARRLLGNVFFGLFDRDIQSNPDMSTPYGEVTFGKQTVGGNVRSVHELTSSLTVSAALAYSLTRTRFVDVGDCRYFWTGTCTPFLPGIRGEIRYVPVDARVDDHLALARLGAEWRATSHHTLRLSIAPTFGQRSGDDAELDGDSYDTLNHPQLLSSLVVGGEWQAELFGESFENLMFVKGYGQHVRSEEEIATGIQEVSRGNGYFGGGDAVRVRLTDALWAKASYERATRLPNVNEVFGDGGLTIRNLELVPEESDNINLSLHVDTGRTKVGSVAGSLLGFGRFTNQQILRLNLGNYFQNENVLSARTLGLDGRLRWSSPGDFVGLFGNVTWQDARNTSTEGPLAPFEGDRLPNRPYLQGAFGVSLKAFGVVAPRDELKLGFESFYVHEFFRGWESAGNQTTKLAIDSQLTHALSLTHRLTGDRYAIASSLEVLNLTNERVYDYYGAQRPGRSVFLKVSLECL